MIYDRLIQTVLAEAGNEGLSVQKISRHVFNASNSLFNPVNYDDVHAYVLQYLQRNSNNPNSIIERTSTRGIYRLNPTSADAQQLMLRFQEPAQEEPTKVYKDLSLSLFD